MLTHWKFIEDISPRDLAEARLQLHHAVQLPGIFGRSLSPLDQGDKFGNLGWSKARSGFISHAVLDDQFQAVLLPLNLKLAIVKQEEVLSELPLDGVSMTEAVSWMANEIEEKHPDAPKLRMALPYEVPGYSASFLFNMSNQIAFQAFESMYGNTDLVLSLLAEQFKPVTAHRCWPHHFDLAALFVLEENENPELEKSIGWGYSPGDEAHPEPYFYVNCWPYPDIDHENLPEISSGGQWNLTGWIGTTLSYVSFAGNADQQQIVVDYFKSSIDALQQLMLKN